MVVPAMLKKPSAFLPIAMSVASVTLVLTQLIRQGPAPLADEGAAAHLWQLLMAAQIPIMGFFAIKWLPQKPWPAFIVLGLQATAALAALAPVYVLHW